MPAHEPSNRQPFGLLSLPKSVLVLAKEAARHLLRRPVVGVCAAGHTDDDRWLFIKRGDTGTWALPGGTLEWGETLRVGLARELLEEAGVAHAEVERVVGVYSRPDRDPRFHAVTVVVTARIEPPSRAPSNPLEIREARLFSRADIPRGMTMGMDDFIEAALRGGEAEFE